MKSIEILTNRLASLRDSYDHYTMVDKDEDKAFWIKNDIEETEILLNELSELKRLKDLKKELGCPLEVVFQKVKELTIENWNQVHCLQYDYNEKLWYIISYSLWDDEFYLDRQYYLKDYQKTWWLKGEKGNA